MQLLHIASSRGNVYAAGSPAARANIAAMAA
jgi:hypothetical protein